MVNLRWLLKYTSGWIVGFGHLGYTSVVLGDPGVIPCDPLWSATQAQRDHKIIHARNFRVHPQDNMGSIIVE